MSFSLLPPFRPMNSIPSFHDIESVTIQELAAKLHSTMNNIITEFNSMAESVNEKVDNYTTGHNEALEVFKVAIRQEFQDFIDIVDLKLQNQGSPILGEIDDAELEEYIAKELEGI